MDILSYSFFQYALLAWIFIAISSSLLGNYIVIRREVQIGHTIANASFLWIILWLIFEFNTNISWIILAIIAGISVYFLEKTKKITTDSIMEYISQISIAGGIFLLSFLSGLKIDILSFLFWNILAITQIDLYLTWVLFVIISVYLFFFWKVLLWNSISYEISKATNKHDELVNISFLILTSILIAISIKIFWILLIWAFLVLPANIWKLLWKSFFSMKIISVISAVFSVISWLFISYFFDASPGSSIVLVLGLWIILSGIYNKIFRK